MTISERISIPQAKIDRLLQAYRAGHHTDEAAALAGIARRTVDKWRQRGNSEPGTVYEELATAIDEAVAQHVDGSLAAITASRASDPRNAQWLLEHSPHTRERYGQRTDTSHDAAAAALAFLASRLPPPPPAAALPAIDAPLLEERTRTHEDTRVELDGRDVTDTG